MKKRSRSYSSADRRDPYMHRNVVLWSCTAVFIALIYSGCSKGGNKSDVQDSVIAKYKQQYLYRSEVYGLLPGDISREDSLMLIQRYVDDWVKMRVIEDKAKEELPDLDSKLEPRLKFYRDELVDQVFTEHLVKKELYNKVSDKDISSYYKNQTDKFRSREYYYSYFFIKHVKPYDAQQVNWMRSRELPRIEDLKEWCATQDSIMYKLDSGYVSSQALEALKQGFPFNITKVPTEQVYTYKYTDEVSGLTHHLMFKMLKVINPDEIKPLALCVEDIRTEILLQRKRRLKEQVYKQLLDEAGKNKYIVIY